MPKITITEKDYTTPGINTYSNFTVLVAGFAAKTVEGTIFEFTTQKEFLNTIGAKAPEKVAVKAIYATPKAAPVFEDQTIEGISTLVTPAEFYATYVNQVYSFETIAEPEDGKGKDILRVIVDGEGTEEDPYEYAYYKLTLVESSYDKNTQYVIVLTGNEGADEVDPSDEGAGISYGNQIAYELLGLGYPVLYKVIDDISELSDSDTWVDFEDKANYDFRFIINGLIYNNIAANETISDLAFKRKDCVAILDIAAEKYEADTIKNSADLIEAVKNEANNYNFSVDVTGGETGDKYAALFAPTICYNYHDNNYDNNRFPAGFHYLACLANSLGLGNPEWFAAAGYTRGVSSYSIIGTDVNFGDAADKALEPRNSLGGLNHSVNLIEKVRNNYYLWGNRTAFALTVDDLVASHFLNIRQLCSTLKKQIYVACRRFTFDPNSDVLWINFCNAIIPTLEAMKANQGIDAYEIIKVATDKKATLKARVRIVPIEAVEDFDIEISLEDSLGGTSVTITE